MNEIIEQDFTKTLEQDTKKMVDLEDSLLEGSSTETITETDEDKADRFPHLNMTCYY